MAILKLYSTGCARNSRTIPYELGTPVLVMEDIDLLMDWGFNERIEMDDDTAMSVDFAVLDDKWAYYVTIENRVAEGVFAVNFAMCGIKTYMLAGNSTIKGQWNKTPTWIDPDTITPAVSGYKRGETSIPLPGLLPEGWVFVDLKIKMKGVLIPSIGYSDHEIDTRHVTISAFAEVGSSIYSKDMFLYDLMYDLSSYNYSLNNGVTFTQQMDIEEIEDMSYSRICPYEFSISNGKPWLHNTNGVLKLKKDVEVKQGLDIRSVLKEPAGQTSGTGVGISYLNLNGTQCTEELARRSMQLLFLDRYNDNVTYDKTLYTDQQERVFFYFQRHPNAGNVKNMWLITKYTIDPRVQTIDYPVKEMYIYESSDLTVNLNNPVEYTNPIIKTGTIQMNMSDEEKKFGVATVYAPNVMGTIERAQSSIPYYFEIDNTGWYLNLELPMNKIVIPSMKLPYSSSAWKAYQFREMEYDRAELSRANQYAKDKFWSDVAKGFGNGAVAGGFAGTHSPKFGAQMGIISMAGAAMGAYADRQVEMANAQRQQENKENLMKNAVNNYYNPGYGYRLAKNNDFMINIAMPIDDMENEVKISGYSCTGNLVASLERGFIQGLPEPSDAIKGTIRNLITSELQMGVWII